MHKTANVSASPQAPGIVRMKDIAIRGNVSVATVSQVLRGQGAERYSAATREKILNVARELGWLPNRLVRGIQTGRTGLAGSVMLTTGEHWHQVSTGLQMELLSRNLLPLAMQPDYDGASNFTELELLRSLMELRVEGIATSPLIDARAVEFLTTVCARQVPVVTVDFQLPHTSGAIEVRTPEHKAMAAAMDHLAALGHKRIGYVGFATPGDWVIDRRRAFLDETASRGLAAVFIEEIAKGDNPALLQLDSQLREVTAVIAATEQLSVSVWHVAQSAGLQIPRDLSIVGFGQFHFDFALWPKFTCINQRPQEIGKTAAKLLADPAMRETARANADGNSAFVEVEPELDPGQTTAGPRRNR